VTFYDGVNQIGNVSCAGQEPCAVSIHWPATGLSGIHTLTAHVYSEQSNATSAPVSVTVVSPLPAVSITTPGNGATVKGNVTISASAATDPSQTDYPTSITFYDGVNSIGYVNCQGQQTCQGSITWRATGLTGPHSLTARVYTNRSNTVTSSPAVVNVISPPPTVTITSPSAGARLGGTIVVSVSAATDSSQVDYPTGISVYDGVSEIGSVSCQGQQLCSGSVKWSTHGLTGTHALAAVVRTNTGRTATSPHVLVGGYPRRRYAAVHCRLSARTVPRRTRDPGVCMMRGVPRGTPVAIQYRSTSGWRTAVKGTVDGGGSFHFKLRGVSRATYNLTVLVSANRVYSATRASIGVLHIT